MIDIIYRKPRFLILLEVSNTVVKKGQSLFGALLGLRTPPSGRNFIGRTTLPATPCVCSDATTSYNERIVATTSPCAGDRIDSTRPTGSPYVVDDRASPKCAATSSSAVPLATHKKQDQRWGVPDELWVNGQGGSTKINSYVCFSAKGMLEVWATSCRWKPTTSLWKLPCCEVLLVCVSNRGLGFTQARL